MKGKRHRTEEVIPILRLADGNPGLNMEGRNSLYRGSVWNINPSPLASMVNFCNSTAIERPGLPVGRSLKLDVADV